VAESTVLLAIETSQRRGEVALRDRGGAEHVEPLRTASRHDDDLMGAVDRVVARAGLRPVDLEAVAVSIGPGGFTGLRIAVSCAKMLAEILGSRLVAVPSAIVVAGSHDGPGPVLVALAAKRDAVWVTRLRRDPDAVAWAIDGAPGLVEADRLDPAGLEVVLADEHLPAAARERCRRAGVPVLEPRFSARACLAAADALLARGDAIDPLLIEPLYARPPEAVTLWRERHSGPDAVREG
jgi:tRNA threonylcarbamoyladenosine biosynthesis protein TsaB